jgi:hypothetical protein
VEVGREPEEAVRRGHPLPGGHRGEIDRILRHRRRQRRLPAALAFAAANPATWHEEPGQPERLPPAEPELVDGADAGDAGDLDEALLAIRQALTSRLDRADVDFYQSDIKAI